MTIIVSAFALGFLAMGLLLLWLGGTGLATRLRALGRWVRVEGRVVEIVKETRFAPRTARYTAGDMPTRPTLQGPQDFFFPVYEFALPNGSRDRVRSPLGAEQAGAHYVDVTAVSRQATTDPTLIADDGLHPSGKMYTAWVELALPTVLQAVMRDP